MKVLLLTNLWPTENDPSYGTFVHDQVKTLRERGIDVDVLYFDGRSSKLNYLRGIREMYRRISRNSYDLVHAHYMYSGWVGRMQFKLPVVVTFHGGGEMIGHEGWLSRRLAPLVDGCTVTSQDHKNRVKFEPARVVPCGIDLDLFKPIPQDEARRELGWDPDRKVMTYIGAHRPEKRVEIVTAAHEILKQKRGDLDLVLPTRLPHDQIPIYMNAADVLVLASDYEGSPMIIKEAMACNLPIVSTPVGDVPEVIDGTDGCYICEQTPEDVAAKVELALAFGKRTNGREAILHLQSSGEVDKVMELYKDVLAKRERKL